jgi:hypothetical protein
MSNLAFKPNEFSIQELINDLKNKKIAMPKIQRGYVWQPKKIPFLFDSLYRGFPINTLILWKMSGNTLKNNNIVRDDIDKIEHLILDGQQRITSLALGFLGQLDDIITSGGKKNDKIERKIMFNLDHKSIQELNSDITDENEEEADEKENINDKTFMLQNKAMGESWIPLTEIYKKAAMDIIEHKYGEELYSKDRNKFKEYQEKINNVKKILDIKIPAIVLNEELKYSDATDIFRRINSTGSKLSGTDLALAILALKWNNCTEFDNLLKDDFAEYGIDYLMIIRQLAIITTEQCKYEAFEKLKKDQIESAFEKLKIIYSKVYDVMKTFDIENIELLPSKYPFYLLCYLKQRFPDEFERSSKLKQWFFSFNAFGIYSSSSEAILQEHINLVKNAKSLDEALLKLIEKTQIKAIDEKYLRENNTTKSSIFKIFYFVQKYNKCKDWLQPNISLSYHKKWGGYKKEMHHIFPQSMLKKEKLEDSKINDIANFTFITSETNKVINSREPSDYFKTMKLFDENKICGHFIPIDDKENLIIGNYEIFLQKRRKLLADGINAFLGLE